MVFLFPDLGLRTDDFGLLFYSFPRVYPLINFPSPGGRGGREGGTKVLGIYSFPLVYPPSTGMTAPVI